MGWTKRLLLGGSVLALSTAAAAAAPATLDQDLFLRSGPGTNYGVIETMPAGAQVDATDCTVGWCRVAFDGREGYAGRAYLDLETAATPPVGQAVPFSAAARDYPSYSYGYGYPPYGYGGYYPPYGYPDEGVVPDIVGAVGDVVGGVLAPFTPPYWYG